MGGISGEKYKILSVKNQTKKWKFMYYKYIKGSTETTDGIGHYKMSYTL